MPAAGTSADGRRRVALYGAGYLAQQVHHHLAAYCAQQLDVLGFIDDTKPAGEPVIAGLNTLGGLDAAIASQDLAPGAIDIVFAIGYSNMRARRAALDRVRAAGYALQGVVHPRAIVEPGAKVGEGSIVLGGAVLDQQVEIGVACFIDIGVRLGAGTVIGDGNYLSSGTSTGSRVRMGDDCFIGMDVTITTDVEVGSRLFINAKSLVPRNLGSDIKLVEVHKSRELPLR